MLFFRLERQEGRLREEAATTAASYEAQLSVMSEHLARYNSLDQILDDIHQLLARLFNLILSMIGSIFQHELSSSRAGRRDPRVASQTYRTWSRKCQQEKGEEVVI